MDNLVRDIAQGRRSRESVACGRRRSSAIRGRPGRRGDERSAFIIALAAALALCPLVWLHYFALLVVVVAVARPRFGTVWFLPLAMFLAPGSGDPTALETAVVLGVAGLTVGLSLRSTLGAVRSAVPSPRPMRSRLDRHEQPGISSDPQFEDGPSLRQLRLAGFERMRGSSRLGAVPRGPWRSSRSFGATTSRSDSLATTSGTWFRPSGAPRTAARSMSRMGCTGEQMGRASVFTSIRSWRCWRRSGSSLRRRCCSS